MDIHGDFSSSGTRVVSGRKKLPGYYPTGARVPSAALMTASYLLCLTVNFTTPGVTDAGGNDNFTKNPPIM